MFLHAAGLAHVPPCSWAYARACLQLDSRTCLLAAGLVHVPACCQANALADMQPMH